LPAAEALPFAQEMGRTVRKQTHLSPAIGLARQRLAAQIAATLARPNHARPVPAGNEVAFLADQPVHFLPLDKETARRLRLLGIRTLGQLAALPPTSVQAQFGAAVASLHKLVRGEEAAPLRPRQAEQSEQVTYHFESRLENRLALANLFDRAAVILAGRLQAAGLAGQTVRLVWEMERGMQKQVLTLRSPACRGEALTSVLHELLEQAHFQAGVIGVTVTVTGLVPATAQQLTLFGSPSAAARAQQTLHQASAKHGPCLYRPALLDGGHPLPERRFQWRELSPV
ncbi:MAG: hypothetical protein L0322_26955, partial [Chloroflexi bacterium]|nr:hypothetical protein [Chloroflexota bacterium]